MFNPMLLSTVNNSIGNKKNHLTVKQLCDLFKKNTSYTELEKYAIDTIQTESNKIEIENFSKKHINHVLSINPY